MELKLTLNNAQALVNMYTQAPSIAAKEYAISLERIAVTVVREAMRNAPVNKGQGGGRRGYGGNLRQSINYVKDPSTGGFVVWVNSQYGVYVDQGTKPHVILPKNKPFLAWKGSDGKWIFARRVNHPGTKPTYFFTNAVKAGQEYGNQEMIRAMGRVMDKLSKP